MEINVIEKQKWKIILEMLWLAYHNPEIDWRTREVKMTRCTEECGKQWRSELKKQKEKEKKKKKPKRERTMEVNKVAEELEI